jgi:membrane fusion protein (multidrug efflux system)
MTAKRKLPVWAFIMVGVLAGIVLAVVVYTSMVYVSTDDAFIDGNIIPISSKIAAHVLRVPADDNQSVKAGDVLVELDQRDHDVRVSIAAAELEAARAEDEQSKQDLVRSEKLSASGEISQQLMDRAVLRARTAAAKTAASTAALHQAELNLSYARIESPTEGHVARKSVEAGAYVQTGQALLAVVSDKKWVTANFKETELTRIRPGMKVSVKIDAYPGKSWPAHVDSIQRGTGARFSLFPPENAAGNFVKVVQRIPVKILFDDPPDERYPLAIGMSVVPEVRVR